MYFSIFLLQLNNQNNKPSCY